MSLVPYRSFALSTCAVLALAACEEGALQTAPPEPNEDGQIVLQEARTVIQEVERPDIFSAQELALWDGRPSLGGMWVAHPDVVDAERVRVTNTANGQIISAALFRRERLNPGPRIQLSSDAASALNILAGQPTELEVIVLRQEEVVIEPAILADPPPEPVEEETVEETDVDDTGNDENSDAEVAAVAATAGAAIAAAEPESAPRQGFWARFRDSLRNDPTPEETVTAPAIVADDVDVAESAAAPSVETAPLDTVAVAAAAIAAAEAEEADAPATPSEPASTSGLRNPFIQIGLFGEQANASAAAASLRQAGIVPTVSEGENANGPFWRILVGPVNTADDQAELLAQVKSLGYADAFLTPN